MQDAPPRRAHRPRDHPHPHPSLTWIRRLLLPGEERRELGQARKGWSAGVWTVCGVGAEPLLKSGYMAVGAGSRPEGRFVLGLVHASE